METNNQGLAKEEKVMFIILGIILLVSIGVLIINYFSNKETNLDNNDTPIKETNGQKDNIKDDSINEPVDILIEEETDSKEIINPVVNIPSSSGTNTEDQSTKPKPQPIVLDWTFKDTMITAAYTEDIIVVEKNVLLTNGEEKEASIVIMKYEQDTWKTIDITDGSFQVSTGLYKYIYSYGSSTKELLLTVSNKLTIDTISILKLNESLDESSTITLEEYTKYQTLLSNTILEDNTLTINNYSNTNNLLPLVITFNEDITYKLISTNTLGITITKEQQDWHEELTPNSIIIWLDLNTIDITNNIISLDIDGVTYEVELNITLNQEESSDTDQGELDNDQTESEENTEENDDLEEESNEEESIEDSNATEEEQEEDLDPIEPTEEEQGENSSQETSSSLQEQIEENILQPEPIDTSEQTS